jgi:hypothetical protein
MTNHIVITYLPNAVLIVQKFPFVYIGHKIRTGRITKLSFLKSTASSSLTTFRRRLSVGCVGSPDVAAVGTASGVPDKDGDCISTGTNCCCCCELAVVAGNTFRRNWAIF